MEITRLQCHDVLEIKISGTIDITGEDNFSQFLDALKRNELGKVILEISEVRWVSSEMVNHMLKLLRMVRASGGELVVCGMQRRVRDILNITGTDRIFNCVHDEKTALKYFREASSRQKTGCDEKNKPPAGKEKDEKQNEDPENEPEDQEIDELKDRIRHLRNTIRDKKTK